MRYLASILPAVLVLAGSGSEAQEFTPAPVDLTGKVPTSNNGFPVGAVDEHGELFLWNSVPESGLITMITRLDVICEVDCLDPGAYVSLENQAADPCADGRLH